MLVALPLAAFAVPAIAENWVTVALDADGVHLDVDKDTIRRGSDVIYYTDDSTDQRDAMAADCAKRLCYTLSMDLITGKHRDDPDWRNNSKAVTPGSFGEAELQYACANAG